MSKEFTKHFYSSTTWRKCRAAYINSIHYLCERCGEPGKELHHKIALTPENINNPDILYKWENLEYLCMSCHQRETFNRTYPIREDVMFDEQGNMIERKPL